MKRGVYWRAWLVWFLGTGFAAAGDDTLSALMQRMRSEEAVRIAYKETRTLELLDEPWEGSGYLYSLPPDWMIKEQRQPERLLMGVKGEQMYYFDPGKQIRHRAPMDRDDPLTLNIGVFKALINADEALLRRLYRVSFNNVEHGWTMLLTPRQDDEDGFAIAISGLAGKAADHIEVRQADGDLSVFSLQREASGAAVAATVERLSRELLGD